MCGICVLLGLEHDDNKVEERKRIIRLSQRLRHRGPDWSGVEVQDKAILAHERLAIIDPESGHQPLLDDTKELVLCVNGEIYNYKQLRAEFPDYPFRTGSDCEVTRNTRLSLPTSWRECSLLFSPTTMESS